MSTIVVRLEHFDGGQISEDQLREALTFYRAQLRGERVEVPAWFDEIPDNLPSVKTFKGPSQN